MIKTLVLFAAFTVAAMFGLSMFWHDTTVVFRVLDIPFTWRLIAALVISGWITSKID